ncbi:MAG: V-type ATP synthase subunit E [Cellulosilyticaceae bacterium]
MVTLEQKLALFSKLLQQDVNTEIGEKIQNMEKQYEEIVQEHKRKVDREARHIAERAEKKGEEKRLELMSKAKMQTKMQSMYVKEKYIGIFITKLEEKFRAFSQTPEYKGYLEKLLHDLDGLGTDNVFNIYMTKVDGEQYGEMVKGYLVGAGFNEAHLHLQEKSDAMLGGFILENPMKNLRIDLSVATLIQDHKEEIIHTIFAAIGEVGESNE